METPCVSWIVAVLESDILKILLKAARRVSVRLFGTPQQANILVSKMKGQRIPGGMSRVFLPEPIWREEFSAMNSPFIES